MTLLLSACATPARQTDTFLRLPRNIPEVYQVQDVSFLQQTENFCGPASLAMMMKWAGRSVNVEELGSQMYTPGKKGTLQSDILSASRRQGMLAVPVKGISALLNLRQFEQTWALADYWGVVVLPPEKLSATADELEHASAAAALEQIGKTPEAEQIYRNILKRWPGSLGALIGLGNTRYAARDYRGSIHFLSEATQKFPQSSVAWHNLATAQGSAKMRTQARKSALHAVGIADPRTSEAYRVSLREWLVEG